MVCRAGCPQGACSHLHSSDCDAEGLFVQLGAWVLLLLVHSGLSYMLIIFAPSLLSLLSSYPVHLCFPRKSKPGWHFPDAPGGTCYIWTYFKDARIYKLEVPSVLLIWLKLKPVKFLACRGVISI